MSRTKPTTTLEVMGPLALNPDQRPDEFVASKLHSKLFVKRPNADLGDGIELLAIANDRENKGMYKLQKDMRENSQREAGVNLGRTEELYKIQKFLRQRFIETNNFLKDCDDKKKAADAKIQDEKVLHSQFKASIKENRMGIEVLSEFKQQLQNTVDEFEPYEKVIMDAIENYNIWTSTKDLIDRCDALMMAQVEIVAHNRGIVDKIEVLKTKMMKLTNAAALTVLGLVNTLAEVDRQYNAARQECLKWEKVLAGIKTAIVNHVYEFGRIADEANLMYQLLCSRRKIFPILRRNHDFEAMMFFVKDEIQILNGVVHECTHVEKKVRIKKGH